MNERQAQLFWGRGVLNAQATSLLNYNRAFRMGQGYLRIAQYRLARDCFAICSPPLEYNYSGCSSKRKDYYFCPPLPCKFSVNSTKFWFMQ